MALKESQYERKRVLPQRHRKLKNYIKLLKKVCLKIWNKISNIFVPKDKMEMQETINMWFEEIKVILAKKKCSEDQRFYKLCFNIIRIIKNYCEASLILLDNNRVCPAMALLRIQIELAAKLSWLINGKLKSEEEFNVRLRKWEDKTLSDRLKLRKDALGVLPKKEREQEEKLNQIAEKILKSTKLKSMPQDRQLSGITYIFNVL